LEVLFSRRAGCFNGNNVRKWPKTGRLSGPMKVNEYLPNLDVEAEKWPIFGRFLTLFPLKCPAQRKKIPPT
jgi:hypothetical protein